MTEQEKYYIRQKMFGLFIAIVFTIGGLISQIGECYLFAAFGVWTIFTKQEVLYDEYIIRKEERED